MFEYWDGQKCQRTSMPIRLSVNNADGYNASCLGGLGIIQAPLIDGAKLIAEGKLVEILKDFGAPSMPLSLVYPHR